MYRKGIGAASGEHAAGLRPVIRTAGGVEMSEALETRIAHLMRAVDDLSDVVAVQAREIALLTRRVEMLMEREAGREADGADVVDRPPHW